MGGPDGYEVAIEEVRRSVDPLLQALWVAKAFSKDLEGMLTPLEAGESDQVKNCTRRVLANWDQAMEEIVASGEAIALALQSTVIQYDTAEQAAAAAMQPPNGPIVGEPVAPPPPSIAKPADPVTNGQ